MSDKLGIFLQDCRVQLPVGVYEHERQAAQPVIITVEAEIALSGRFEPGDKDFDRTVSYETLYNFIQIDLPRMGHIFLLESVAEAIIDFCFRDARIMKVHVRLEKPAVFPAATPGIALTRKRPKAKYAEPSEGKE